MWRWRLILNDWPCTGAHPLNTTRGCRGRDLVARPVSPEPPANPLLDGEQTGRCSASRAGPRHPDCAVAAMLFPPWRRHWCARSSSPSRGRRYASEPLSLYAALFPSPTTRPGKAAPPKSDGLDFAYAQRLRAFLPREGFPHACIPKTVSSTRRQYASMTLVFSADSPLVICISGPNPESVAVRLTII